MVNFIKSIHVPAILDVFKSVFVVLEELQQIGATASKAVLAIVEFVVSLQKIHNSLSDYPLKDLEYRWYSSCL